MILLDSQRGLFQPPFVHAFQRSPQQGSSQQNVFQDRRCMPPEHMGCTEKKQEIPRNIESVKKDRYIL